MQLFFHTGALYAKAATANATPQSFGTLQNVSVDFAITTKELFGQNNFPVAVGAGAQKVTGKATSGQIQARFFNDVFINGALANGETLVSYREVQSAIPGTPYQVIVANAATFVEEWEVINQATGLVFTKVASAPATGQYSVNPATGVFTFAAADTGIVPIISYSYTVAASGQTVTASQTLVGAAPTFSVILAGGYNNGVQLPALKLYSCVATKFSFQAKQNDFALPTFEFMAMANAAGVVYQWSSTDNRG